MKSYLYSEIKKWDLPKGKAEKNESIDVTALREVYEETGVKDLSISQPLEKTFHIFKRNSSYFLKVTYWFEMKSDYKGRLKPQLKEGISKFNGLTIMKFQKFLRIVMLTSEFY